MTSPLQFLQQHFEQAFEACGLPKAFGKVTRSDRPDLAQFQCNGALAAAKQAKANPRAVADQVLAKAAHPDLKLDIAGPGFINITLSDAKLAALADAIKTDPRFGVAFVAQPENYLVEYASPNVAKAMHVGHLRSGVIGDSLRRLAKFVGHNVLGINHWGDWGTPMGMVLLGLEQYAKKQNTPLDKIQPYVELLAEIYPQISAACKEDPTLREQAKALTVKLQNGDPYYRAVWQKMVDVSKEYAEKQFYYLGITLDKMRGESDAHEAIAPLVEELKQQGIAVESEGALIIPMDDDKMPPLILYKSDGGVMYGTTDLATIAERVKGLDGFKPDHIWYIVDHRQSLHFKQLFEAAHKAGILGDVVPEHLAFGTMNGTDGKPFKTRDGGVLNLQDLILQTQAKAVNRLGDAVAKFNGSELMFIPNQIAVATLRFADLSVHRTSDYIFDLEKFSSFEGKTGPYLQYTAVRIQSMLDKAAAQGLKASAIVPASTAAERDLMLALTRLPEVVQLAFNERAPNVICDQAFELAQAYSRFYNDCHILTEKDVAKQGSWLSLSAAVRAQLKVLLELLGIDVPAKM